MKIILKESRSKMMVQNILNSKGIKLSIGYGSRTRDYGGGNFDSVYFWFKYPDKIQMKSRRIWFHTENNEITGVDEMENFTTITDVFKFIPSEILNSYFIELGKEFLEKTLQKYN